MQQRMLYMYDNTIVDWLEHAAKDLYTCSNLCCLACSCSYSLHSGNNQLLDTQQNMVYMQQPLVLGLYMQQNHCTHAAQPLTSIRQLLIVTVLQRIVSNQHAWL